MHRQFSTVNSAKRQTGHRAQSPQACREFFLHQQTHPMMNWFYADGSQQKGPVSEVDLAALVRQGAVKPETLIWREGLPDWQPLSVSRPDLVPSAGAPVLAGIAVPEQNKDLVVQQMREGTLLPGGAAANPYGLRYAGFWIRVGAKLIDGLVYMVCMALLVGLIALVAYAAGVFTEDFGARLQSDDPRAAGTIIAAYGVLLLFMFGFQLGYNGYMVKKWGATLGKMACGIKVVTSDGQPVSWGRSIGRAAADMINNFICNGLTYIMVAIDEPEKRGLHDHIASTRVVYK
jgi:uncharacterized RDD family membrane protein YckC